MCVKPLQGYRSSRVGESGKRGIVFSAKDGFVDLPVEVPCGRCIECRLERSRQWAMRCVHEASLHEDNCFVTLTYDEEHLPSDRSLNNRHLQLFFKRLRKTGRKFRYYACGEYGETTRRPHYHAILFGIDFADKRRISGVGSNTLYASSFLESVWQQGLCSVGSVTFDSAAYVARYCVKKVLGEAAEEYYRLFDGLTGETWQIKPEYSVMSRRPGIGAEWLKLYKDDLYNKDFVTMRGVPMGAPRAYDKLFEKISPERLRSLKDQRVKKGKRERHNHTYERNVAREKVVTAKSLLSKRGYS